MTACSDGDSLAPAGPTDSNDAGASHDASAALCDPSASSLTRDVFAKSCNTSGCHSGGSLAAAALDLTVSPEFLIARSAGTCDGQTLIVPGDPENSWLVRKLEGRVPADCGDAMPPTGALDAEALACVRTWIASLSTDATPPPA